MQPIMRCGPQACMQAQPAWAHSVCIMLTRLDCTICCVTFLALDTAQQSVPLTWLDYELGCLRVLCMLLACTCSCCL